MSKPQREIRFHSDVADLGCWVCGSSVTAVHHLIGKKWPALVIPLCPKHHQYGKESLHGGGKKQFRKRFKHEWQLFFEVKNALKERYDWPDWCEEQLRDFMDSPLIHAEWKAFEVANVILSEK